MERALVTGIAVLRAVFLLWMVLVLAAQRHELAGGWHSALAWILVGIATAVTVWLSFLCARQPVSLLRPMPLGVELLVATALMVCDGIVFKHGHIGSSQSTLAAEWPLACVLSVGVVFGEWPGVLSGIFMGVAKLASEPLNGVPYSSFRSHELISILSTFVLFGLAGAVSGYAVRLLRRFDYEISRSRAREDVSRTLHDGVLQTLAYVERRTNDPALASMAREQEQELRAFLAAYVENDDVSSNDFRIGKSFGRRRGNISPGHLEVRLRREAVRFEERYSARVDVVVAADTHRLSQPRVDALTGAVAEALTNAGKHGAATKVTVFVEPADRDMVFCSVKDNGRGFDESASPEGLGITGSIRGRVNGVGGRIEIEGGLMHGAEVRMWL